MGGGANSLFVLVRAVRAARAIYLFVCIRAARAATERGRIVKGRGQAPPFPRHQRD